MRIEADGRGLAFGETSWGEGVLFDPFLEGQGKLLKGTPKGEI